MFSPCSALKRGSLFRTAPISSPGIDGVDYPLEHDKAASNAGTRAAKELRLISKLSAVSAVAWPA